MFSFPSVIIISFIVLLEPVSIFLFTGAVNAICLPVLFNCGESLIILATSSAALLPVVQPLSRLSGNTIKLPSPIHFYLMGHLHKYSLY